MKPTFKKATQSRVVAMNGRGYAWDAAKGLDPSVALEVEGFIRKKAWGYTRRGAMAGLEFEDLVQEGCGANYLTYAAWWIDAAMKEALSRPIIRTPDGEAFARVDSIDAPHWDEDIPGGRPHPDWQRSNLPDAHELSSAEEDRARIQKALPNLDPRDRAILIRHLGLNGQQEEPLGVVAKELGITRQRAGQLLDRARMILRRHLQHGAA